MGIKKFYDTHPKITGVVLGVIGIPTLLYLFGVFMEWAIKLGGKG